jgi:Transposase IS66 family
VSDPDAAYAVSAQHVNGWRVLLPGLPSTVITDARLGCSGAGRSRDARERRSQPVPVPAARTWASLLPAVYGVASLAKRWLLGTHQARRMRPTCPPTSTSRLLHQPVPLMQSTAPKSVAPLGVEAPVQYGPRIAAIIVCLHIGQFFSQQRAAQALAWLFGIPLSSGTMADITVRTARRLDGFLEHTFPFCYAGLSLLGQLPDRTGLISGVLGQ